MITMSHEIAKLILEHAGTFVDRTEAIATALKLGMPLHDIEEYLDWLDNARPRRSADSPKRVDTLPRANAPAAGDPPLTRSVADALGKFDHEPV